MMFASKDWRGFFKSLREGPFTSLGSYPKFWLMADGETMSHEACIANALRIGRAMRSGTDRGWSVIGVDINWEDPDMYCVETGKRIESAYAEP